MSLNTINTPEMTEIIRKLKAIGKKKAYYRKMWIEQDIKEISLKWALNALRNNKGILN